MQKWHIETPSAQISPKDVLKETNVEVRRELLRKVGIERMLGELPTKLLDKQGDYELFNIELSPEIKNARYLKMTNPSIPNTFHMEGVEGNTVQEALNFRARSILKNGNWNPEILT